MTEPPKGNLVSIPELTNQGLPEAGVLITGVMQIAAINKEMPFGYRYEPEESLGKVRECKEYKPSKKKKVMVFTLFSQTRLIMEIAASILL